MNYNFKNILDNDFIGNSLSTVNLNYSNLDQWSTSIQYSADRYFEPLRQFYLYYGDFWKDTITYSYSINAPQRLMYFDTFVAENSAKWIKPIIFYYPEIIKYNSSNINSTINSAKTWLSEKYPVLGANKTNFVEDTVAYLNIMFYEENQRIPSTITTKISAISCRTNDTSTTVNCWTSFIDDIGCYADRHACGKFSRTYDSSPNTPSCQRVFNMNCEYENRQKTITRRGILNVNSEFKDRYEHENVFCLVYKVKNCEWTYIKTL